MPANITVEQYRGAMIRNGVVTQVPEGLITSQVVVLSGGVSVGQYDYVPEVLKELGVEIVFHSVRMKPGKPLLFGRKGDVLGFGLPGNPVSAVVGFELCVRPAIATLAGRLPFDSIKELTLTAPLKCTNDRPTYYPARRLGEQVAALPWIGSADLRSLLSADALIELPAGDVSYPAGHTVIVREL